MSIAKNKVVCQGQITDFVSDKAKKRGRPQLGSLGAGNHFLEIQVVDEIFDKEVADVFGLEEGSDNYYDPLWF